MNCSVPWRIIERCGLDRLSHESLAESFDTTQPRIARLLTCPCLELNSIFHIVNTSETVGRRTPTRLIARKGLIFANPRRSPNIENYAFNPCPTSHSFKLTWRFHSLINSIESFWTRWHSIRYRTWDRVTRFAPRSRDKRGVTQALVNSIYWFSILIRRSFDDDCYRHKSKHLERLVVGRWNRHELI